LQPWLPLPVLFATYQWAGWFGRRTGRPPADAWLLAWDLRLFGTNPGIWLTQHLPAVVLALLDLSYFSYYLLLLVGPWVMVRRHGQEALVRMWWTVGLAFFLCYLLFPWFPSTSPRLLYAEFAYGGPAQALNLWVLDRFSVGANVFPSAHVAAGFSFAFVHLRLDRRWGALFLIWAVEIGVSTVSGGYHYAVDAVAGAAVGLAAGMAVAAWRLQPGRKRRMP